VITSPSHTIEAGDSSVPTFTGVSVPARSWRTILPPNGTTTLALLLVCVVIPIAIVAFQVDRNRALSPADEYAHLDYVVRLTKGELPVTGDRLDPRTLRIEACVRIDAPKSSKIPPCDVKELNASAFPGYGFNHEAQQPPLYYAVTAAYRAVAERLTGDGNFLQVARLGGIGWLIAGLLLSWVAGRLLGAPAWALLAVLLVLAASPAIIYYSSIVSNDATALFAGALVLTTAVVVGPRPRTSGVVALAVCGGVVAALKPTNGVAVLAVALYLGVVLYRQGDRGAVLVRSWLRSGGALVIGAVVVTLVWVAISGHLATMDGRDLPVYQVRQLSGLHLDLLLSQATNLLWSATDTVPQGTLTHPMQLFVTDLVRVLFLVPLVLGIFVAKRRWFHLLGVSGALALLGAGFGYGLVVLLTLGMDPGTGSRYGISVLPALAVVLAFLAVRARVVWLVGAIGAVGTVTTLVVLATA
jgi:hypothetical protein